MKRYRGVFVVKCYKKSELAMMYFPEMDKEGAVKKLKRWINNCPMLLEEIKEGHYLPTMKSFTAREVKLIVHYLGEPY